MRESAPTARRIAMLAEAAALEDAALLAEIARLERIEREAETREDELSPAGYAWLYLLHDERARRGLTEAR